LRNLLKQMFPFIEKKTGPRRWKAEEEQKKAANKEKEKLGGRK
jgi:hypothetical protein